MRPRGAFRNRAVAVRKWSLKYGCGLWSSLSHNFSLGVLLCKDEFSLQVVKINFSFLKIMISSVIQNHIREAFITLESFGLSQSFQASFLRMKCRSQGCLLIGLMLGLFCCRRRTVLHRRKNTIRWDIVVVFWEHFLVM